MLRHSCGYYLANTGIELPGTDDALGAMSIWRARVWGGFKAKTYST